MMPATLPICSDFATVFREETPGIENVVHLNAAGAGLPPRAVTEAVVGQLHREAKIGPHWAAAEAGERLDAVRAKTAMLLGCQTHNIAFGPSAGRLWAMALLSRRLARGSRVLIARSEWASNVLNLLKLQHGDDLTIDVMPVEEGSGRIDVERAANLIDARTVAICVPLVGSGCGVRQPVEALSALPRPEKALLFLDAAQAVGGMPVDLATMGADVLVAPARKWLRGPRGEAFMALSDRALSGFGDPPLLDQFGSPWIKTRAYKTRDDAGRFETYEFSAAGRLGLGAAVEIAMKHGIARIRDVIKARLVRLHAGLSALPGVRVFEDPADGPAFLTFVTEQVTADTLNELLAKAGIATAVVSKAYARMDFESRGLVAVNRVAPHAYTTETEIDRFLRVSAGALTAGRPHLESVDRQNV